MHLAIFATPGELPERSNGAVSKTVIRFTRIQGSNP